MKNAEFLSFCYRFIKILWICSRKLAARHFFRKNIALCKKNNPDGHFYYKKTFERAVYRRLCIMLSAMLMNFLAGAQLSFLQLRECAFYSNTGYDAYSRASELLIVAQLNYLQ